MGLVLGAMLAAAMEAASGSGLSWREDGGVHWAAVRPEGTGQPGFRLLPPSETGVTFTNVLPKERALASQVLTSGSGVAAGDVDGDGRVDLYFCGLSSGNRLYRNLGGWRFEDVTARAGVGCDGIDSTGAVFADVDGDGDLDLIVNSFGGGTHLFFNDGQGRFRRPSGVLNAGMGGTSLALADIDNDGDLDLYVANYRTNSIADEPGTRFSIQMIDGEPYVAMVNGLPVTHPEVTNRFRFMFSRGPGGQGRFAYQENGEPDVLYLNDGQGRFTPVPFTGGRFLDEAGKALEAPLFEWGLTAAFRDLNGDGHPDLFVCNDFDSVDRIWINDGRGGFRALDTLALRQICYSSMSLDFADLNRDGFDEILTADMFSADFERRLTQRNSMMRSQAPPGTIDDRPLYSRNMLFLNRGDGTYAEIAQYAGLEGTDWTWAPVFLDVDLDGFEDLLVVNGFERDNMNLDAVAAYNAGKAGRRPTPAEHYQLRELFPRLDTRNLAYRNRGDLRFEEVSALWGFNTPKISQGLCLADLDNDGDLDVVVNNMNDVAGLYRNLGTAPRVGVRLAGIGGNTRGVGARILLHGGPGGTQSQEMMAGGRYMAGDDAMRVFAAGSDTNRLWLEVLWRSGRRSVIEGVQPNRIYTVKEAAATGTTGARPVPRPRAAMFEEVTGFKHRHDEPLFDDFARQPLLPRRYSQTGPGVAWHDLDGDGWDDLIIGAGKGGRLAIYRNDTRGGFTPWNLGRSALLPRDAVGIVGLEPGRFLVALSHYEEETAGGTAVQEYDVRPGTMTEAVPAWEAAVGPLSVGDVDGDGALDLFVGGRVIPGRHPEAADSRVYRQDNGRWVLDANNSRALESVGLVSGSVFSDLDGDGWPELILAVEWGPVRVFRNRQGRFEEVTRAWGFDRYRGWWNGVTTGDLDGDGRLDIVAGNWGRNTRYEGRRQRPVRLYYGDLDGDGTLDLIEAAWDPVRQRYLPERRLDVMARAMPFLSGQFASHAAYAAAGIEGVLGAQLPDTRFIEANWLETTLFLNRGDRFEAVPLPEEAQWSPAFAVAVADCDGDGHEDVFLGQNFFAVESETSRHDAGRGLWLRGDGRGGLQPVPAVVSGIAVYGEQRGAALGDYDRDGRVDVVVTQNGAATRLFKNVRGEPGLRVRLAGGPGNPAGVGAVIRLGNATGWGPARAIHAGSGYASQDSLVAAMHRPGGADRIEVRWPGGKRTVTALPVGSREIRVQPAGEVEVLR